MALAILLALAVTVFVLYTIVNRVVTPTQTTADPYAGVSGTLATLSTSTSTTGGPVTTNGGAVGGTILVRPYAATASSSLKATSVTDFRPTNLLDSDLTSAWADGAAGTGVGQWVRLEFDQTIPIIRIDIANGYQKDADTFAAYERVKSIGLQYSDNSTQVVELLDTEGLQVIQPAVKETRWIKLTILSVYPTNQFENAALSEVQVYETIQ
jgi:hypothetical protein